MSETATITVPLTINWERVGDLVCAGIEGGTSGWLSKIRDLTEGPPLYYADGKYWAGTPQIMATYDNGEGNESAKKVIQQADAVKALQLMAEKYPRHFGDFMNQNEDAETGDVFLQLLVLGDVVYG